MTELFLLAARVSGAPRLTQQAVYPHRCGRYAGVRLASRAPVYGSAGPAVAI